MTGNNLKNVDYTDYADKRRLQSAKICVIRVIRVLLKSIKMEGYFQSIKEAIMKRQITFGRTLIACLSMGMLLFSFSGAMDSSEENYRSSFSQKEDRNIYALNYTLKAGDILYSFATDKDGTVGVTVVGDKVIVSVGEDSADVVDNKFYVYNFDGTLVQSFPQGSTTGLGFRDLAFDGSSILASEDNTIKKIDPNTFQITGSITNTQNAIHRGLAYDAVDNVIWSANGQQARCCESIPPLAQPYFRCPIPSATLNLMVWLSTASPERRILTCGLPNPGATVSSGFHKSMSGTDSFITPSM